MQCPSIIDVRDVIKSASEAKAGIRTPFGLNYVPARAQWSINSPITRIKAAWLVFTGKADAVTWPGQ